MCIRDSRSPLCGLRFPNQGQNNVGWILAIMQDRLMGDLRRRIARRGQTRVEIAVPAWEAAGCHLYANAMTSPKDIAGRPEVQHILVGPPRLDQCGRFAQGEVAIARPDYPVGEIERTPIGLHVKQSDHEVSVRGRGNGPEMDGDW